MASSVWVVILFTILLILLSQKKNKINTVTVQELVSHKMTKQLLVKTEWQLRQLPFVLFSGLEGRILRSVKAEWKKTEPYFIVQMVFILGKMFNFAKF